MDIGFVQNVNVQALNLVYQGDTAQQHHRRKASFEGQTLFDGTKFAKDAFYSSLAGAMFSPARPSTAAPNANAGLIQASDAPDIRPPSQWDNPNLVGLDAVQLNLIYQFDLFVVARTKDLREEVGKRYPTQAGVRWSWDATGTIGPRAGGYVWNANNTAPGITIPSAWVATVNPGSEPEKLSGDTANKLVDKEKWPKF
jgi:hypothetical protein